MQKDPIKATILAELTDQPQLYQESDSTVSVRHVAP